MLAVEVAKYIESFNLGTFDETGITGDIFISTLPASPDSIIAIYPRPGPQAPGYTQYDSPDVQIVVRGTKNPIPAATLAQSIYNKLHGLRHQTLVSGGLWILSCLGSQSGPVYIGQDENGRHEYSLNFHFTVKNTDREV